MTSRITMKAIILAHLYAVGVYGEEESILDGATVYAPYLTDNG